MNDQRELDLDRILSSFLDPGPMQAPDRILRNALTDVGGTQQLRPLPTWRLHMSRITKLAIAAVLTIGLIAAGVLYVGNQSKPAPPPSASPSPTGSAEPTRSPVASQAPTPSVAPSPAVSALTLAKSARSRVDKAITAARTPTGITQEEQNFLLQRVDDIAMKLDGGDIAGAQATLQEMAVRVELASFAPGLDDDSRTRLQQAIASLGRMLVATPFTPADLGAATYFSTTFAPVVAITIPAGWARNVEDREVLALTKGSVTLAFDHMAAAATADGLVASIGATLQSAPKATSLGRFSGFTVSGGGGTLWFTEGLLAHDAGPGSEVRIWVVDLGSKVLTIHLDGPSAELGALLPEIDAVLATLESL